MFGFIKALVGGASYANNPTKTGATYLQQQIKQAIGKPETFSNALYEDLAQHCYEYAEMMMRFKINQGEAQVTIFTNQLDNAVNILLDVHDGRSPIISDQVRTILEKHHIKIA